MRIIAAVNSNDQVFISWNDQKTSGTLELTPEEAEAIGAMGRMAHARRNEAVKDSIPDTPLLKDSDFDPELKDMPVGESGYVVPWALAADKNKRPWLRLFYTYEKQPGGTVQMLVQRLGKDHWQVMLPRGEKLRGKENPNPNWDISYNLNILKPGDFV